MNNPNEAVLLTDDGRPIGELVVAMGGSNASVPVADGAVEENRAELLKAKATELTGEPDADAAITEMYPGYTDMDLRKKALFLYVAEAKSIEEIAAAVGVPGRTVSQWAYTGRWDALVRNEIAARRENSVLALARIRANRRVEIVREQLDQAKRIRDAAMVKVDEGHVGSGSEAWASAAKIEHTLTGLSEAGALANESQEDAGGAKGKDGGKTPLVVVFNGNGGLPPRVQKGETVDVQG